MTTQTTADIVAACMSAVNDRDPRIVAALDIIEAFNRSMDLGCSSFDATQLALDTIDRVYVVLSRPSTVSQPAIAQAGPA